MRKGPDFWFWLCVMAGFLALLVMSVVYGLDSDSPLFLSVLLGVSLVAVAYLGSRLSTDRLSKAVDSPPVSTGQRRGAQESPYTSNIIKFMWILGPLALIWVTADSLLPWWVRAAPYLVPVVAWLCYRLVVSKIANVER